MVLFRVPLGERWELVGYGSKEANNHTNGHIFHILTELRRHSLVLHMQHTTISIYRDDRGLTAGTAEACMNLEKGAWRLLPQHDSGSQTASPPTR